MPSFGTHRRLNYIILIVGLLVFHRFWFDWYVAGVLTFGYIVGTELITPDLDTDSVPSARLGFLWWPYKKLMKHRRSSHGYVIGFLGRMVYAALLLAVFIVALVALFGDLKSLYGMAVWLWDPNIMAVIAVFVFGIAIANGVHITADHMGDLKNILHRWIAQKIGDLKSRG